MLMQNFGVTNKEHYGMLRYFLEWSIGTWPRFNIIDRRKINYKFQLQLFCVFWLFIALGMSVNELYLSIYVFSTKVLTGDTIFFVPYWRRDRHFTCSSEPREGLAIYMTKAVHSLLSCFKTLSIGPFPESKKASSRSTVKRSTNWANPASSSLSKSFVTSTKHAQL